MITFLFKGLATCRKKCCRTRTQKQEHSLKKKKKNYVHIKRDQLVHAQHICCIQLDYMIL